MEVVTERAESFRDPRYSRGTMVRHVFRTSGDGRRTTAFYECSNQAAADILVAALKPPKVTAG